VQPFVAGSEAFESVVDEKVLAHGVSLAVGLVARAPVGARAVEP